MSLGLFLVTMGVALVWSGLKNKDLREAIPLILKDKDPNSAGPISGPLLDDTPRVGGADPNVSYQANLGEKVTWSKQRVFLYGLLINRTFGTKIISQCRTPGARTRSGGISLHGACRALDLKGTKNEMTKLAKWAYAQKPAFQEVIYTHSTTPGISDSVIADHDGRRGTEHVHIGFPVSGRQPVVPGSKDQSATLSGNRL